MREAGPRQGLYTKRVTQFLLCYFFLVAQSYQSTSQAATLWLGVRSSETLGIGELRESGK